MDWLANAFWAHIGWALGDAVIGLLMIIIVGALWFLFSAPRMIRQARCAHLHYRETGSCDAICNDCGKNLGFIGRIRDLKARQ
jgi:hypothetical protein